MDDLCPLFALGFGLFGHGAQHGLREIDLLDLHVRDFHAVGRGVLVEDALDAGVQLVAMGQQLVELDFAEHGAQGGLGKLLGLPIVILHLDYGLWSVYHAPVHDCIALQSNVVAGDDVLRGNFQRRLAEVDANHAVDRGKHQNDAWSFGVRQQSAQQEDHATLIFAQDFDGVDDVEPNDNHHGDKENLTRIHSASHASKYRFAGRMDSMAAPGSAKV